MKNKFYSNEPPPESKNMEATNAYSSEENAPYISPTPGEIPIIGFNPFTEFRNIVGNDGLPQVTKSALEEMKDCGFNAAIALISKYSTVAEPEVDFFEDTGIGLIASYSRLTLNSADGKDIACINLLKNKPGLVGWYFKDEPLYEEFESLSETYKKLLKLDPKHMFLITLVGGPVQKFMNPYFYDTDIEKDSTGNQIYEEFLNKYQDLFKPPVFSYDLYPVRTDNNGDLYLYTDRFYSDFEIFSRMAKKTGRPFWAFCQSEAYHVKDSLAGCPAPKEEYLRYEAFSALAYGAQGIQYWTYGQNQDNETETYLTALVGKLPDGSIGKTEYWYYARTVNAEIKKFTSVFLGCELISAVLISSSERDAITLPAWGPFTSIQAVSGGALVTVIKNGNMNYAVIVNSSPLDSAKLLVEFAQNIGINIWTPTTPSFDIMNGLLYDAPTMKTRIPLNPGEYAIIPFAIKLSV